MLGAGLAGSWEVEFGSWGDAAVVVVWSVAAGVGFLAWVGFSWLPFLFLMRILPRSSDGLGICWPGFSWMVQINRTLISFDI